MSIDTAMTLWSHDPLFGSADVLGSEIFDFGGPSFEPIQELPINSPRYGYSGSAESAATSGSDDHLDSEGVLISPWDASLDFSIDGLSMRNRHNINDSGYLVRIGLSNVNAQQSADLIMEALYAIPNQMLRRETFPPFIHPHWQLSVIPEPLAVCMHLAEAYSSGASGIQDFVRRSILTEQRRAVQRLDLLSNQDLLACVQAGIVYLTMRLVDGVMHDLDWTHEMLAIQNVLCTRFLENNNFRFCNSEQTHPSSTWEDWIYAESRRRVSLVWFLITRTIVVMPKTDCHTTDTPETLPLPAPQTQWEARTRAAWHKELEMKRPAMTTFGNLVQARQHVDKHESKKILSAWNATTDRLGSLLNIAVVLV